MLKCSYCGRGAKLYADYFDKFFCKQHLKRYLEKKLKRNLNHHKLINPGDKLEFLGDESPTSTACLYLLEQVVKDWPVSFVEKGNKKISITTVEVETHKIVDGLFRKQVIKSKFYEKNTIKPFRDFVTKELFTLGYLMGNKNECKEEKISHLGFEGVGPKLNLLRAWDQLQEGLEPQHGTENK